MEIKDVIIGFLVIALVATVTYFLTTRAERGGRYYDDRNEKKAALKDLRGENIQGRKTNQQKDDRDCTDFATQAEAQDFFVAAGGPEEDPHRLDRDNDGVVCETLP